MDRETSDKINSYDLLHDGLRKISAQKFLQLGLPTIAYVRPVREGSDIRFAVYSADGKFINMMEKHDEAVASIAGNNMCCVLLQ